jgi:hypothetical protein
VLRACGNAAAEKSKAPVAAGELSEIWHSVSKPSSAIHAEALLRSAWRCSVHAWFPIQRCQFRIVAIQAEQALGAGEDETSRRLR